MARRQAILRKLISQAPRIDTLARQHGFRNVRVFGSVARGEATRSSDVDFLVDAKRGTTLFDLAGLQLDIEELLKRKVDVATPDCIWPEMKERVFSEARSLSALAEHTGRKVGNHEA